MQIITRAKWIAVITENGSRPKQIMGGGRGGGTLFVLVGDGAEITESGLGLKSVMGGREVGAHCSFLLGVALIPWRG